VKSLQANDFELFGLPQQFALDRAQLDELWKVLQREAHPDRFAAEGAAAQRVAMQWSVRINEAYQRLKDPLKRAAYLCELRGVPVQAESNTAMPPAFLMQQMEWREALEDTGDVSALEDLADEVAAERKRVQQSLGQLLDGASDAQAAVGQVRALISLSALPPRWTLNSTNCQPDRVLKGTLFLFEPWRFCRFPNRASRRTRTSGASPLALTWAPPIRWWPPCAMAWPNACPTGRCV